jgi:hypothetical protein
MVSKTERGFVGMDLKFGQTPAAGIAVLTESLKDPPSLLEGIDTVCLSMRSTKRYNEEESEERPQWSSEMLSLFIPAFPFTDIQDFTKATLIQELMQQCWNDRRLKLSSPSKLFLSLGLDFSGLLLGWDLRRLKRQAGELVRDLA